MEELTLVPLDANDREQLLVISRNPGDIDIAWLSGLISRYDIARSFRDALMERPERVAMLCEPSGDDELVTDQDFDCLAESWGRRV